MGVISEKEIARTLKALQDAGGVSKRAAEALGMPESTFRSRLIKLRQQGRLDGKVKAPVKQRKKRGISLGDLMSQHDPHTRAREAIRQGIKLLEDGAVLRDTEFREELCGTSSANCWRAVAVEKEFRQYQFTLDNKVWWATPVTVQEAVQRIAKAKPLG